MAWLDEFLDGIHTPQSGRVDGEGPASNSQHHGTRPGARWHQMPAIDPATETTQNAPGGTGTARGLAEGHARRGTAVQTSKEARFAGKSQNVTQRLHHCFPAAGRKRKFFRWASTSRGLGTSETRANPCGATSGMPCHMRADTRRAAKPQKTALSVA